MFVLVCSTGQPAAPRKPLTHHRQRVHRPPGGVDHAAASAGGRDGPGSSRAPWHDGVVTDATDVPADDLAGLLARADHALARTVDGLSDDQYAQPSQLPGWTRAHVLAHLALNAEALAAVLDGARGGRPVPMYASPERRDTDIAGLAATDPAALRTRLLASTARFAEALAAMGDGDWAGTFDRTPGQRTTRVRDVPLMRVREVEIHHADLGCAYAAGDWPPEFCAVLLDSLRTFAHSHPFTVRPDDLPGTWRYGAEAGAGTDPGEDAVGPVVTGTAAALGWWLTGRGGGEDLTSDTGTLPGTEAW